MGRDSCVDISNMDPGSCQPSPAGCSVTGPATTPLASYAPTPLTGCGPGAAALGDPGPQGPAPAPASGAGGAGACHVGAASGAGTAVAGVGCAGSMNGSSSPRVGLGLGSWACSGGGGGAGGVPGNGLGTGADTPEWSTVFEQEVRGEQKISWSCLSESPRSRASWPVHGVHGDASSAVLGVATPRNWAVHDARYVGSHAYWLTADRHWQSTT